jgi:hypothetical protein
MKPQEIPSELTVMVSNLLKHWCLKSYLIPTGNWERERDIYIYYVCVCMHECMGLSFLKSQCRPPAECSTKKKHLEALETPSQHGSILVAQDTSTPNIPSGCLSNPRFNRSCFWHFFSSHKNHHFYHVLTVSCEGVRALSRNVRRPCLLNFCQNHSGGHFFPSFFLHCFFLYSLFFTGAWFLLFA